MKLLQITIATATMATLFAFTTKQKAATTYNLDTKLTTATWLGKKVTGKHAGAITVSKGFVEVVENEIKGGEFDIDMSSITCTDLADVGYNAKLIGHLKSDDFFGVDKFPTAKFILKNAKNNGKNNYEITGNLSIKGITQPITFTAVVKMDDKKFVAVSTIKIDRTKYDIKYGSKSFFESIGDKAISDDFELNLNIVAIK